MRMRIECYAADCYNFYTLPSSNSQSGHNCMGHSLQVNGATRTGITFYLVGLLKEKQCTLQSYGPEGQSNAVTRVLSEGRLFQRRNRP